MLFGLLVQLWLPLLSCCSIVLPYVHAAQELQQELEQTGVLFFFLVHSIVRLQHGRWYVCCQLRPRNKTAVLPHTPAAASQLHIIQLAS
jgi:hypothetical protein